ncbi:metal-dependent hydrolase [Candidatus Woesearchaeota archaeon]|nr:metal-dependent hydrolase [Candidatus Woesearchaeota archaeon]
MPDLITHVLIGLIICELFNIRRKSLVILGSVLPDLVLKISLLSFFIDFPMKEIKWLLIPFHTPVGLILLTIIIILFFRGEYILNFLLISLGWALHLAADLTNKEVFINQMLLLYPISWKSYELNIFWSNQYWYLMIISLAIYLLIIFIKRILRRKKAKYI